MSKHSITWHIFNVLVNAEQQDIGYLQLPRRSLLCSHIWLIWVWYQEKSLTSLFHIGEKEPILSRGKWENSAWWQLNTITSYNLQHRTIQRIFHSDKQWDIFILNYHQWWRKPWLINITKYDASFRSYQLQSKSPRICIFNINLKYNFFYRKERNGIEKPWYQALKYLSLQVILL